MPHVKRARSREPTLARLPADHLFGQDSPIRSVRPAIAGVANPGISARLLVGEQLLDGLGRHRGAVGDLGGDAGGVAVAAVQGSMVQPGPEGQRPPFDPASRLRRRMGQHGMRTGKWNVH